ncbi:hypothetical protein [Endozoicomonas atrinae]|uniref:hypothetical protein n=1 Tax=Endozoicomonas atrinae TaxID=1333660 RepID=UPI003AFF9123
MRRDDIGRLNNSDEPRIHSRKDFVALFDEELRAELNQKVGLKVLEFNAARQHLRCILDRSEMSHYKYENLKNACKAVSVANHLKDALDFSISSGKLLNEKVPVEICFSGYMTGGLDSLLRIYKWLGNKHGIDHGSETKSEDIVKNTSDRLSSV